MLLVSIDGIVSLSCQVNMILELKWFRHSFYFIQKCKYYSSYENFMRCKVCFLLFLLLLFLHLPPGY